MQPAPVPPRLPVLLAAILACGGLGVLALWLMREAAYRGALEWSSTLPTPVQGLFSALSEYGIPVLMVLFGLVALRARRDGPAHLAAGIAAGIGVVLAYLVSETLKVLVSQVRPCHEFAVSTITACPEATSWAWPSNHATIAAAIAIAVLVMSVRLGLAASLLGALTAISRVVVGVHYFHDVLTGALLGAAMVLVCARWVTPLIGNVLALAERSPTLDRLLTGNHFGRSGQTSDHPPNRSA